MKLNQNNQPGGNPAKVVLESSAFASRRQLISNKTITNMNRKNSQPTEPNVARPAAYIAAKHVIMNAKDATDLKQAQKAIDNYIYKLCEKPLREQRQLDLTYILNWKISQLRDDGIDTPEPKNINISNNQNNG